MTIPPPPPPAPLAPLAMANKLKLKDVFTPGGQPSVTYVGRDHLRLEDAVASALAKGFAINVVTGPTKSGKTVLCNRVLANAPHIAIEGGQVRSEADFWNQIAHRLNLAGSATTSAADTGSAGANVALNVGLPGLGALTLGGNGTKSSQKGVSATYTNVPIISVLERLLQTETALLIDDFHYIDAVHQRTIIQSLKGAVFQGLTVILLAVPHRAFDPITVEDELQGRFRHTEIPPWSMDDLLLIPKRGFDALNVVCPAQVQRRICQEGFGNPLLVQEVCSELCDRNNIRTVQDQSVTIDGRFLEDAFAEIAKSKGFPKYRKLKEGPEAHKERQGRLFKDGRKPEDIYSAIMTAIGELGPKPRTSYDEIRTALRDLLIEGAVPAKHEITAALSHMSRIAKEKIEGEPPIEWVRDEDALVITDPFLLFYMKWSAEQIAPGSRTI